MAYRVLSRYTRPNTSIEWHNGKVFDQAVTDEVMAVMFSDFHSKKERTVTEVSPTVLEVEFIWESEAVYNDWASRSCIIRQQELIDEYNASVGIIADPKVKEQL